MPPPFPPPPPARAGLEQDVKNLQEGAGRIVAHEVGTEAVQHVMLSYEWGCQQSVMLIKSELQKAGYQTWMDIDKMSGGERGGGGQRQRQGRAGDRSGWATPRGRPHEAVLCTRLEIP